MDTFKSNLWQEIDEAQTATISGGQTAGDSESPATEVIESAPNVNNPVLEIGISGQIILDIVLSIGTG